MATSATSDAVLAPAKPHSLLADYAALFKLRVSTMVIITAGAGFYLGSLRSGISPFHIGLIKALAGIAIVTAGSSVLNQALERSTDLLMPRTASRPMAQRRISLAHGLIIGFLATFAGQMIGHYGSDQGAGFITATIGALVVLFIWNRLVASGTIPDPGNR